MKLLKELEELKTIKILLLSDNDIDDSAIPAIVALISNPKVSLERLDLGGNNITEEGAKKLLAAAKEKESLCELVLSGNPEISDECIKEVETLMETREKKKRSASPS